MNFRKLGAITAVLLAIPVVAAADTLDTVTDATVVARTFNYVGVSHIDLQKAQAEAEAILRQAGVDISWLNCWSIDREPADASPRCRQPLGATDLVLRIGSAKPDNAHPFVSLGFSLVNAADGKAPYLATVYADLVGNVARGAGAGADANLLPGRAIDDGRWTIDDRLPMDYGLWTNQVLP
jgi:hypothetical protein